MNFLSMPILATTFKVIGAILAVPSVSVLLLYGANEIRRRLSSPKARTNFGSNPDAILMILKGITESIGLLAGVAGWLGKVLLNGLAVVSVFALVLGVACWFTGSGLQAQATWARVIAFVLILLALLPSLLLALSVHNFGRVLLLVIVTFCAFGLYTLWLGYAPQVP